MRAREFIIEAESLLTQQQVDALFNNKTVSSDLNDVLGWFFNSTVKFSVKENVPIEQFVPTAKEMISTYDEFPEEGARTKRIKKLITQGNPQLPIFVDSNDNFILEGRHRIAAFYELGIPTVTVIYAHATQNINEIGYADVLTALTIPPADIIPASKQAGSIDGQEIYQYKQGNNTLFFIKRSTNQFSAIVLLDGNSIKAVKNYVNQPGLVTTIIGFIVHTLGIKLQINPDEGLTRDGFRWLRLLILRNSKGFTITDQNGAPVDIASIEQEHQYYKDNDGHGPTTIYISEGRYRLHEERVNDSLMSTTYWIGDERIL